MNKTKTNFKNLVDSIVRDNTDYDGLADMESFESVQIENSPYMDLYVTCEYKDEYTVAHYLDNDARKSAPMIRFDLADDKIDPKFLEYQGAMKKRYTDDQKEILEYVKEWISGLDQQF